VSTDKNSIHILIVDDDPGQRSLLFSFLSRHRFQITQAVSGEDALSRLGDESFSMMISDVRMPGLSGLEALQKVREKHKDLPVLMVTAFPDIRDAVTAMQDGAVNYLQKPIDLDELLASVETATGLSHDEEFNLADDHQLPVSVIVKSAPMEQVFRDAAIVAESDSRVLITGESGTGKEVLTDVIHGWSDRASGPIVKINCAAIPENLLESELFGHKKGAFTGATADRTGRFEEAHNGTILLDEIGEMSASLQAKLLRITQDGSFQKVGGNTEQKTNARILAATNRDLEKEVAEGRFREDLFYRLNVMEIFLPPLRERRDDIIPLANLFATEFSDGAARISSDLADLLLGYNWPGNIRELRNAMERAVLMSRGELILPDHLPPRIRKAMEESPAEASAGAKLEDLERETILKTLREKNFNRTETAKALGISRRALTYKIQALKQAGFPVDPQ
jgi:DNA-binding NtrC family response regulator